MMSADTVRRAAFLLKALEDLRYELDAPAEEWKTSTAKPVNLMVGKKINLYLTTVKDDGDMHDVATIDGEIGTKLVKFLIAEIDAELRSLGVEVPE